MRKVYLDYQLMHKSSQPSASQLKFTQYHRGKSPPIQTMGALLLCIYLISSANYCLASEKNHTKKAISAVAINQKNNTLTGGLRHTVWWQVAQDNQLDPYVLYAVALVESATGIHTHQVTPWPWALNTSGKSIIPKSQQEASVYLHKSLAEGRRQIDVGLMQINVHWHGHRVEKAEQLLNPVTNIQIGAALLAEAIQSAPNDLVLGIGHYHSWQNTRGALAYGQKVLAIASHIRELL